MDSKSFVLVHMSMMVMLKQLLRRRLLSFYFIMDIVKKAYTSRLLCTGNDVVPFYRNDYNNVVSKTNQDGDNDNIGNVLGFDMVNQY